MVSRVISENHHLLLFLDFKGAVCELSVHHLVWIVKLLARSVVSVTVRVFLAFTVAALRIWHNDRRNGEIKSAPKWLAVIFYVETQVNRYHPEMSCPVVRQSQVKVPVFMDLLDCLTSLERLFGMAETNAE